MFLLIGALPMRGQTPTPSPSPVQQIEPQKAQLIRQVLDRSKEAEQAQERILHAIDGMKLIMPRVGEKFWDKYRQLINLDELRERLVYVYDKYYTTEELSELLKFYDSPLGKKVSDNAVPISRESVDIAQDLSKRAMQSVAADVQAERLLQMPATGRALPAPARAPLDGDSAGSPAPSPSATATAP